MLAAKPQLPNGMVYRSLSHPISKTTHDNHARIGQFCERGHQRRLTKKEVWYSGTATRLRLVRLKCAYNTAVIRPTYIPTLVVIEYGYLENL